ncbi:hypothetical protein MHW47_12755, partial [Streptomyces sp. OfavH-34-F]|nr:hypothetical protein [Streptomyces sp. OfavH-34-F]
MYGSLFWRLAAALTLTWLLTGPTPAIADSCAYAYVDDGKGGHHVVVSGDHSCFPTPHPTPTHTHTHAPPPPHTPPPSPPPKPTPPPAPTPTPEPPPP